MSKSNYDFDRTGAGVGRLSQHEERSIIPTPQAVKRLERLARQATTCDRCHLTDVFDGVMFTTDPASGLCDDCC